MLERDRWYSPAEVAEALGVHAETVRRWVRIGRVPAKRLFVGRAYRIKGSDVLDRLSDLEAEAVKE